MNYQQSTNDWPERIVLKAAYWTLVFLLLGASQTVVAREEKTATMVEGYHHLPPKFLVSEYHVNGGVLGHVGFDEDGGDTNCCIRIPRRWRPGLTADVRWMVWDWSAASEEEIKNAVFSKARLEGIYRAQVPVERYDEVGYLFVHFFPGGRARISVSNYWPESTFSPIRRNDPKAVEKATQGRKVSEIYTKKELEAQDQETKRYRKKYGDWR